MRQPSKCRPSGLEFARGAGRAFVSGGPRRNQQYAWGFGAYHPSGANFAMCDGSTRFITADIDYFRTFQWLNRHNDRQIPKDDRP